MDFGLQNGAQKRGDFLLLSLWGSTFSRPRPKIAPRRLTDLMFDAFVTIVYVFVNVFCMILVQFWIHVLQKNAK